MDGLNVAILVVLVLILLYLIPATRACVSRVLPWAGILGGVLFAGYLLTASKNKHHPPAAAFRGGAEEGDCPCPDEDVGDLPDGDDDLPAGDEEDEAVGLNSFMVDTEE